MKRFKFRLQRVLDYRNVLKKEQERMLAQRNMELFSAEERVSDILSSQDKTPHEEGELTMAEFALTSQYQERLTEELIHQRLMVLEAAKAVDDARDAYIEKAVESETLAKLKERKFEEYRTESKRTEKKEMNEFVVQRHGVQKRKKGGSHG